MKILIVIEYFYPHIGGVETVFMEIGRRFASQRENVIIFTTSESSKSLETALKAKNRKLFGLIYEYEYKGIRIIRLSLPQLLRRYVFASLALPLMLLLFRDVDVIHSANNYTVALPCFLFGKLTGKPVTITVWEIWDRLWFTFYPKIIGFFFWIYEKTTLSLPFNIFFTPSTFVSNQLVNISNDKKVLAPLSGKSLEFNKNKRVIVRKYFNVEKNFVFLYYGRWGKNKGIETLIKAFAKTNKKFPSTRLFLFISHPSQKIERQIFELIVSLKLRKTIFLLPPISETNLAATLSSADCVVIPDMSAAFGLSALEASEAQRPIVTTTAGAIPEVVFGKVIFVRPASIASLAEGMMKAYLGKWKLIPKKNFSWDKTTKEYTKAFAKLLKS